MLFCQSLAFLQRVVNKTYTFLCQSENNSIPNIQLKLNLKKFGAEFFRNRRICDGKKDTNFEIYKKKCFANHYLSKH